MLPRTLFTLSSRSARFGSAFLSSTLSSPILIIIIFSPSALFLLLIALQINSRKDKEGVDRFITSRLVFNNNVIVLSGERGYC